MFNDAQQSRIRDVNRIERGGVQRDFFVGHLTLLEDDEKVCALELRKVYRKVAPPALREWQENSPGIGEHLVARLLGLIGDPVNATPKHWRGTGKDQRELVAGKPYQRKVSQLWSYCGVGDPTRRRHRGMDVEEALAAGIPRAKSLVYLMAESCVKVNRGPYRELYDQAREQYAERLHAAPCVRCGPSGKPAKADSPWSPGHQHAAALRKVSKEILKDMWLASRSPG